MKRIVSITLAMLLVLSLAACGNNAAPAPAAAPAEAAPAEAAPADAAPADAAPAAAKKTVTTSTGEEWPTHAVTCIVPYAAGSGSDLTTRILCSYLEEELGVPVVIDNQPGGSGWVGWSKLLYDTEPDGYTFALISASCVTSQYREENPRTETEDDFIWVYNHFEAPNCIAIRADETRYTDYASLIEFSKTTPLLTACNSIGITSADASHCKHMEDDLGAQIDIVPVDGGSDAMTMLLAGEIDFMTGSLDDFDPDSTDVKVVVQFGSERSDIFPDVPIEGETGVGDGTYFGSGSRGYGYMKGVDPAIVARLTEALAAAGSNPEQVQKIHDLGGSINGLTGDDFLDWIMLRVQLRKDMWLPDA